MESILYEFQKIAIVSFIHKNNSKFVGSEHIQAYNLSIFYGF
jgi:hypothetical protein